jgi:WXG100 family type VII secretion target
MPNDDGTLYVSFGALYQGSTDIGSALTKLQSYLSQVEQDAKPLVNTWEGDAKEAYYQRQSSWQTAAADLSTMLGEIRKAVDNAATGYSDTEKHNASLFYPH